MTIPRLGCSVLSTLSLLLHHLKYGIVLPRTDKCKQTLKTQAFNKLSWVPAPISPMYWKSTGDSSQKQTACAFACVRLWQGVRVSVCAQQNPIMFPMDCEFTLSDHRVTRASVCRWVRSIITYQIKTQGYTLLRRCDGGIWHSVNSHPKPQATLPSHKLPLPNTHLARCDSRSGCQVSRVTCGFNVSIVCHCCFCCSRVAFLCKQILFSILVIECYSFLWCSAFNRKASNSPYPVWKAPDITVKR